MGDVKMNDVGGTLLTIDYCDFHIKGLRNKNATSQTGSVREGGMGEGGGRRSGIARRVMLGFFPPPRQSAPASPSVGAGAISGRRLISS